MARFAGPRNARKARTTRFALRIVLGLAVALTGCATTSPQRAAPTEECYRHGAMRTCVTAPPATAEQITAVHRLSLPPLGRGRLLIVRNDWADAHGHAEVQLDGRPLLATIPCSVLGVDVPPGPHALQVLPGRNGATQTFEVASGELQVWRIQRVRAGARSRGFTLARTDADLARQLVPECRVLGLLDRRAP